MSANTHTIRRANACDLNDRLGLVRAYCEFYTASPADEDLLALVRALLGDHDREAVQLLARDVEGRAVAFANVYRSWSTTSACRIGVMNDLFVAQDARGQGLAEALIDACRTECTQRGGRRLTWLTAPDNLRAQAIYERVGATAEHWLEYSMPS